MPTKYAVRNRGARPHVIWGFRLPKPLVVERPTVALPAPGGVSAEARMGEIIEGNYDPNRRAWALNLAQNRGPRFALLPPIAVAVWTGGISDCMLVCYAYYVPAGDGGVWDRFCFQHIKGGLYEPIIDSIEVEFEADFAPVLGQRFALIASGNSIGVAEITGKLVTIGVPAQNILVYESGTGNSGFHFGLDFSSGRFGEVNNDGSALA